MTTSNPDRGTAAAEPKIVTACVLIIGNEILSGRTQDENLSFLARGLNEIGIRVREAQVIPDDADVIVATVNDVRGDSITFSPPAGSARPMTTSPPNAWPTRLRCL